MAIYKGTAGKRIGSVGNETYSVVKGQNVVREKPAQVANPRTYAQMEQRSIFVDAVRFYEHANKNLFKFAFEDKRSYESDYNAFMRANAKNGVNISPSMSADYRFPAIGNWLLTSGSLQGVKFDYTEGVTTIFFDSPAAAAITTVGQLSTKLLADYPSLKEGDVITGVMIESSAYEFNEEDLSVGYIEGAAPKWLIYQFRINSTSATTLAEVGLKNVTSGDSAVEFSYEIIDENVGGVAVIVSREVPGGVKVSTTSIINNAAANTFLHAFARNKARIIAEWGLSDPAILQGSIADGQ